MVDWCAVSLEEKETVSNISFLCIVFYLTFVLIQKMTLLRVTRFVLSQHFLLPCPGFIFLK
jgi:hypothetical protein